MHLETALFFETPEQIYARVFRNLKPRTPIPEITVSFRRYANANSRITLREGRLQVVISDLLQHAPAPIQEALACVLLSKLFHGTPDHGALARYRLYLNRADVRGVLQVVKRERGRKQVADPKGRVYDLTAIFEDLNGKYFEGGIVQPELGWSPRASTTTLGHFDPSHNVIVLSRLLDSEDVPSLAVEYVMFHEMLHLKFPTEHGGLRRCVHTRDFKVAEKRFEKFEEARKLLRLLVEHRRSVATAGDKER